jgi:hypothetical protein
VQNLNPLVQVTVDQQKVAEKDQAFFSNFDLVVMAATSFKEMVRQ